MKKRITVVFDEDDDLYIEFIKYVKNNYLTLSSAIKQAIIELLKNENV